MLVRITEIPPEGKKTYEGDEYPSILEIAPDDRLVTVDQPVRYRVIASVASSRLIVQGKVWTEVRFRCSRCSDVFPCEIRDDAFERVIDLSKDVLSVDLTADIRETILLHFSGYPVCRADCRGLCSRCGANLNKRTCHCTPTGDSRWGGLDGLRLPCGRGEG